MSYSTAQTSDPAPAVFGPFKQLQDRAVGIQPEGEGEGDGGGPFAKLLKMFMGSGGSGGGMMGGGGGAAGAAMIV